jgi:hypothetical protein
VLRDVFVPEHRSVMVGDLFAGTRPGALVHSDYPVLRAPCGFLVSYSLAEKPEHLPIIDDLGLRPKKGADDRPSRIIAASAIGTSKYATTRGSARLEKGNAR